MNDKTLFRPILLRSWEMMWRRPSMWILAFLAAAVSGMGVFEVIWGVIKLMKRSTAVAGTVNLSTGSVILTWLTPPYTHPYLPLFALLFIAISLMLFLASTIALGALIRFSVDKREHTLSSSWKAGVKHVWEMALLVVVRRGLIVGIIFGSAWGVVCLHARGFMYATLIAGIISFIATILIMAISFLAIYAQTAVVVDQLNCVKAVKKSLAIFRHHILLSLEMATVLFVVELLFSAVAAVVVILIVIPVFMLYVVSGITGFSGFIAVGIIIGVILLIVLAFLFAAWSTSFTISAWSYLYIKTRNEKVPSRILHHFGKKR